MFMLDCFRFKDFYVEEPEYGWSGGFSGVEQSAVFLAVSAGEAVSSLRVCRCFQQIKNQTVLLTETSRRISFSRES